MRVAAEKEEREFYRHKAPKEWLDALAPFGTNEDKPFLDIAPYLIVIFAQTYSLLPDVRKVKITAATSGMALATVKLFVAEGAYVFITGRRQEKLDEAVKAIGKNVTGVQGDAANLADLERLFEIVRDQKGHIDVLFASAGLSGQEILGSITEEQFDAIFGLNVRGTLFTVQKALPLFSDGGSIVLNGSIAGVKGLPGRSVYGASKAALRSFARTWLVELKDRRIRVNVLSPGPIDTPAMEAAPVEMRE